MIGLVGSVGKLLTAAARPFVGMLDLAPVGASVAFSLRKLRAAYSGPAIRVRRSSDGAEANIGFAADATGIDTAALLTHCEGGSGFIVTWYDQSGNGRNASNATAARQPRIVNNGVIDQLNGRAAAYFGGGAVGLYTPNFTKPAALFVNVSGVRVGSPTGFRRFADWGSQNSGIFDNAGVWSYYATQAGAVQSLTAASNVFSVVCANYASGTSVRICINGIERAVFDPSDNYMSNFAFVIGNDPSTLNGINGYIPEAFILSDTLPLSYQQSIENAQMLYYGISP